MPTAGSSVTDSVTHTGHTAWPYSDLNPAETDQKDRPGRRLRGLEQSGTQVSKTVIIVTFRKARILQKHEGERKHWLGNLK